MLCNSKWMFENRIFIIFIDYIFYLSIKMINFNSIYIKITFKFIKFLVYGFFGFLFSKLLRRSTVFIIIASLHKFFWLFYLFIGFIVIILTIPSYVVSSHSTDIEKLKKKFIFFIFVFIILKTNLYNISLVFIVIFLTRLVFFNYDYVGHIIK